MSIIVNHAPDQKYDVKNRFWQGCPTILRTPGGRLFAGWYSGGMGEPHWENYNLLIRSDDDGMTWNFPEMIISGNPETDCVAIDIQLWLDPMGRMWLPIFSTVPFSIWAAIPADPSTRRTLIK